MITITDNGSTIKIDYGITEINGIVGTDLPIVSGELISQVSSGWTAKVSGVYYDGRPDWRFGYAVNIQVEDQNNVLLFDPSEAIVGAGLGEITGTLTMQNGEDNLNKEEIAAISIIGHFVYILLSANKKGISDANANNIKLDWEMVTSPVVTSATDLLNALLGMQATIPISTSINNAMLTVGCIEATVAAGTVAPAEGDLLTQTISTWGATCRGTEGIWTVGNTVFIYFDTETGGVYNAAEVVRFGVNNALPSGAGKTDTCAIVQYHGLSNLNVNVVVRNSLNVIIPITTFVRDANNVILNFGGSIIGTWNVSIALNI
jgi:hypothetical protein